MERVDESEGQRLFGLDAIQYDRVRPDYPATFFSLLRSEQALGPGTATLDIGSGSGTATRRLIEGGADPITLIEPDQRFRQSLLELQQSSADVRLLICTFEDAELESSAFDLIVAATAFHWLAPAHRVDKISRLVKGGGYVALVWNLFQDSEHDDDFHEATRHLLEPLARSPSTGADALPFALDRKAREAEFCGRGLFERAAYAEIRWSLELDASRIRLLYQSFSSIARLPESERTLLLDEISSIAADTFGGKVMRNMTTPIYLFRRRIVGYAD